ncbi:MAG TPA: YceI family protein [Flavobacteriales bacterium]|jgi:polyisoprenoid-binding protein YceI|nr:YceI family protein [Flavobacteriales bacterium]
MKKTLLFAIAALLSISVFSQRYFTRSGEIVFYSSTPVEDIEAINKTVASVFDAKSGKIEFAVTLKSFVFEKALMQEHFNENYVESDTYPKATLKGDIQNISELNFAKDGNYPVKIAGKLTMHGVTKDVAADGNFAVKGNTVLGTAKFMINPEDYNIKIPSVVRNKIAEEIEVTVTMNYELMKK